MLVTSGLTDGIQRGFGQGEGCPWIGFHIAERLVHVCAVQIGDSSRIVARTIDKAVHIPKRDGHSSILTATDAATGNSAQDSPIQRMGHPSCDTDLVPCIGSLPHRTRAPAVASINVGVCTGLGGDWEDRNEVGAAGKERAVQDDAPRRPPHISGLPEDTATLAAADHHSFLQNEPRRVVGAERWWCLLTAATGSSRGCLEQRTCLGWSCPHSAHHGGHLTHVPTQLLKFGNTSVASVSDRDRILTPILGSSYQVPRT